MVDLIDLLLDYAGEAERSQDLFLNRTIFKKTKTKLKQYFKEVPNVLT